MTIWDIVPRVGELLAIPLVLVEIGEESWAGHDGLRKDDRMDTGAVTFRGRNWRAPPN